MKIVYVSHVRIIQRINHKSIWLDKLLIIEILTFLKIFPHLSLSENAHAKSPNVERNIANVIVQELNALKNANVIHVKMENVNIKIKIGFFNTELLYMLENINNIL